MSGLGEAPFSYCSPSHTLAINNIAFFCEHCGTMLKNRYFVMSSDGKVSVVGIDCLRKTGDKGLIAATNEAINDDKFRARNIARQVIMNIKFDKERELFNGKTKDEACCELLSLSSKAEDEGIDRVDELAVTSFLSRSNFGISMLELAIGQSELTKGMINSMIDICAKGLSHSRKNSTAYKSSLPKASALVKELTIFSSEQTAKLVLLRDKRIEIINTIIH